ncbi:MAG: DUF1269 domain-containing protein [Clostridia bacterium]|nr:DUF1269 domain-containing protein [Clostridia bacterium]
MAKKESIITAVFEDENVAYKALTKLKDEQKESGYTVKQLGLMTKSQGHLIPLHGFDMKNKSKKAATRGGVIGGLIGLFSGPVGLLIGTGLGATIGHSTRKKGTTLGNNGLIEKIMEEMPEDDAVILIALANEEDEPIMSSKLRRHNATSVKSFDVELLTYEIKEAKKLEKKMKKEQKKKAKSADGEHAADDEVWGQKEE